MRLPRSPLGPPAHTGEIAGVGYVIRPKGVGTVAGVLAGQDAERADRGVAGRRPRLVWLRPGLSHRDAAARLFLSPRTADFHLRNVVSKPGVTPHAELAALDLD